jgi:hypothetical protein
MDKRWVMYTEKLTVPPSLPTSLPPSLPPPPWPSPWPARSLRAAGTRLA